MNTKFNNIAIIGMAGNFPGAASISQFWENICEGRESIYSFSDSELKSAGVSEAEIKDSAYVKASPILADIDKFDPAFFKISPVEAELMDPQLRLFLQCAWETLEDAGHATRRAQNIGVFAGSGGVTTSYFSNFVNVNSHFEKITASPTHLGNDKDFLATYISYKLNLTGPSMTIQTACSTSLVALHQACSSVLNGECDMALAGGVTIRVPHIQGYQYSEGYIFSKSGHIKTFDEAADGVVFGSGLGLVLIKKLDDAIRDKNHIYAVVKGSAISNDGKEKMSYAAASAKGQIACISNALNKAQVDASTIGFVEAHGTGTFMGDPEEVKALSLAFKAQTDKKSYCALGAVKTNVGHLEAAAGITGFIKAVLALHHKKIPPTLHFNKSNPRIKFDNTPFFVNNTLVEWNASDTPRRAAVNSLGVGGTNAFVVLEEYIAAEKSVEKRVITPVIVPISAKTKISLQHYVQKLADFIATATELKREVNIADLAYSLQIGRDAMEYRVAFVASSIAELSTYLNLFLAGAGDTSPNVFVEQKPENKKSTELFENREYLTEVTAKWIDQQQWGDLAELWVNGIDPDWQKLYSEGLLGDAQTQRISLPTYIFAKDRYWIESGQINSPATTPHLHPLLHTNTSDLIQQSYSSTFNGEEFFLNDHQVNTDGDRLQKILPGVAYLEMARAAVEQASPKQHESSTLELHNVVWVQPIVVTESKQVTIALFVNNDQHRSSATSDNNQFIDFEIYSQDLDKEIVHCQGQAIYSFHPTPEKLDIAQLKLQMERDRFAAESLYASFTKLGLNYGAALQGITAVYLGEQQLLAQLNLPTAVETSPAGGHDYCLHPTLMDSALQATIGLLADLNNLPNTPALPFALDFLRVLSACTPKMFAWVRYSAASRAEDKIVKLDIDLCDQNGNICIQMRGYSSRMIEQKAASSIKSLEVKPGLLSLVPSWNSVRSEALERKPFSASSKILLLTSEQVSSGAEQLSWVQESYPNTQILHLSSDLSIAAIKTKMAEFTFDQLLWIAPDVVAKSNDESKSQYQASNDQMVAQQEQGLIALFRIIKSLLELDYANKDLQWTIITGQTQAVKKAARITPTHAGVFGLIGSLAKEFPHWNLTLLDVDSLELLTANKCLALVGDKEGNGLAYRQGEWFRQDLTYLAPLPSQSPAYKQNGVYIVIGGAGGLGEVWSRFMIEHFQAKIIWIGRQENNPAITDKIKSLSHLGHEPFYISADATNLSDLEQAYKQILEIYPAINGVVHSAIVLQDQSLTHMEETKFRASLSAKVDISVNMDKVFGGLDLDFMIFFSSMMSFTKSLGQANYAAGCTFKDSFAHKLGQQYTYPVKIMNWGYWGNVGIVTDKFYTARMAQVGVGSIEASEGMESLQTLVSSDLPQVALIKTLNFQGIADLNLSEAISYYPATASNVLPQLQTTLAQQLSVGKEVSGLQGGLLLTADMDKLAKEILAASLISVGLIKQRESNNIATAHISAGNLLNGQAAPFYERWLTNSIHYLQEQNILDNKLSLSHKVRELNSLWLEWDTKKSEWASNVNLQAQINLLEACLKALPDILRGKQLATDVMFPNSSMELVEGVYNGNALSDYYNEALGETLSACIQQRLHSDKASKIRILEIGAGTGGTTTKLLPLLKEFSGAVTEYCYTDLSKAFLMHAEEHYQPQFPALTTAIFDVSKPLASQTIAVDHFDFVIATNVLHATPNIRETLRNVKATLKNQGILLLNEISTWSLFSHLTFGLLEGWWLHEDTALRLAGSVGLAPEKWQEVLEDEGYADILFPVKNAHHLGQQIIASSSDGWVRQRLVKQLDKPATRVAKSLTPAAAANTTAKLTSTSDSKPLGGNANLLRANSIAYFQKFVAETLRMKSYQLDAHQPLAEYGLDSILVVQLTNKLRKIFPEVKSTLFFEVQSIDGIVDYFLETKRETLIELTATIVVAETPELVTASDAVIVSEPTGGRNLRRSRQQAFNTPQNNTAAAAATSATSAIFDVAIIGVSGRYPQSPNLNAFWKNLANGVNCVTEIPQERWNWQDYYDAEKGKPGKIYSKWGGFLTDIDKFDPLFFKISPKEAKRMDPQERLFLQSCYHAIEDAGYTPETLGNTEKVGVFVGVMNSRYTSQPLHYSIANRVSFVFNFQGPSMAVDTACSASLTAIHVALESMYGGLSECAVVGGVNLIIDPVHYLELSELTMLSSGDQCKSFGDNADGFVDAEGVGSLVLKPLQQAVLDGDHIHGVIKGSSVNAGGKTNGYTVPNPKAQSTLVSAALARANLTAEQISYIEAHGTGTALGDPIEVAGLARAFRETANALNQTNNTTQFCAIGSLKSNIGHCESAAGIAGLTKVLLQLKHKKLVPSLHSDITNPEIDFSQTPFKIQKSLENWARPIRNINGIREELLRIAGISSFGAGGANAHIIVAEYQPLVVSPLLGKVNASAATALQNEGVIIPLSARTAEQLQQKAIDLLDFIRDEEPSVDLIAMAYTLQVGREAMEERLGFLVNTVEQLAEKLNAYIQDGSAHLENVYQGQVKNNKETLALFIEDGDLQETLAKWIAHKKFTKLLDLWVKGLALDWHKLYGNGNRPQRLSLPIYPFAKERYWIDPAETTKLTVTAPTSAVLHPLLHTNTSDLSEQRYTSTFSGEEFFLVGRDASKNTAAQKVLPAMAYLEMARVAVERALPASQKQDSVIVELHNIVWAEPVAITANTQVTIVLFEKNNAQIDFEIYATEAEAANGQDLVQCQGQAIFNSQLGLAKLDVVHLNKIQNDKQLLVELRLPLTETHAHDYAIYPGVSSALQAAIESIAGCKLPSLPFAVEVVRVFSACTNEMFAWVRYATQQVQQNNSSIKLDIDLCDAQGNLCVQLHGISYQQTQLQLQSNQTPSNQAVSSQTLSNQTLSNQTLSDQAASNQTTSNHLAANPGYATPRHITLAPIALAPIVTTPSPQKISFAEQAVQTLAQVAIKKPSISLAAPAAITVEKSVALEKISKPLAKTTVTLSQATLALSLPETTPTESSAISLFDNGNGIFSIHIVAVGSNKLTRSLLEQLSGALAAVQQSTTVKVLIISGTGQSFLSGGREEFNAAVTQKLYQTIAAFPCPVIAVMQGDAAGAGFLLGALCDFMICSEEGNYSYTNLQEGLYPTNQEYRLFAERFGDLHANHFLYLAAESSGKQLREKGWTCPILPAQQVQDYAQQLAATLAKKPEISLRLLKQHLARRILKSVVALTIVESDLLITDEGQLSDGRAALSNITSPAKNIRLETHAEKVLLIRIAALHQASKKNTKPADELSALVKDLTSIFAQLNAGTHYHAAVLVSEYNHFLPDVDQHLGESSGLSLQRLIRDAQIPVIAVLDKNAKGLAWLTSLLCDACVYSDQGQYVFASVRQNAARNAELAKTAAMIFAHRFGHYLGKEILLTGNSYSGSELQQRVGTVTVVAHANVLATALQLAESWIKVPRAQIVFWKKETALNLQEKIKHLPTWLGATSESDAAPVSASGNSPVTIALSSSVITATAHPEGILVVNMEDRQAKNMFSDEFISGINEVFAHIETAPNYKVIVLAGYDNYFACGGTKENLLAIQEGKAKFTDTKIYQLAMDCKVPVIAAMQGHAIGGGWSFGMFADFIFFSAENQYVSPYMNYGFTPGAGSTLIFPDKIGYDLSRETLLTAHEYTGSELKGKGLLLPVLPRKDVRAAAMNLAKQIALNSRTSLIALKHQLTQYLQQSLDETYNLELAMHDKSFVGQTQALDQINDKFLQSGDQSSSHQYVEMNSNETTQAPAIVNATPNTNVLPAITANLKKLLAHELHMQERDVDEDTQFVDMGLDSISGVTWVRKINDEYKISLELTKIYSYPTLTQLSRYVKDEAEKRGTLTKPASVVSASATAFVSQTSGVERAPVLLDANIGAVIAATALTTGDGQVTEILPEIIASLKKLLAHELHMQEQDVAEDTQFVDMGLDSISGVTWVRKINDKYKISLELTKIYSYPTLTQLSRYVRDEAEKRGTLTKPVANKSEPGKHAISLSTGSIPLAPSNKIILENKTIPQNKTGFDNKVAGQWAVAKLVSWRKQGASRATSDNARQSSATHYQAQPIAVIGMACQFPQAKSLEEFWENIAQGKNCISKVSAKRWDLNTYYHEGDPVAGKTNCQWMGALEEYDLFDPLFFAISPIEAESMEPQQRIFLQACWHAIENAGYNAQTLSGSKCGVFVGCGTGDYQQLSREHQLSAQGFTGGANSILAARIAYILNLQGPCLSIDTACSSSLVALANACESLTSTSSDLALVGGVSVMAGPAMHIMTSQTGMLSPDGRCFTFDQRANGFVPGEGVGVVMLKRLADAQKDQDMIYGTIEGWGINQDGKSNGITAPNPQSQTRLMQDVYDKYNIDPTNIQLLEAHGTGTKLGDPIEIEGLKESFKKYTQKQGYCALGSVKSNIGHCLFAAGISGFIKLVLALKHKQLPPTINFSQLNEHIGLHETPFYINSQLQEWKLKGAARRQGAVSSFGFSGTNAHIVIGEYLPPLETYVTPPVSVITQDGKVIIPLSAKTTEQLTQKALDLLAFIRREEQSLDLIEMAYTLQVGRQPMEERLGFLANSVAQLAGKLEAYIDGELVGTHPYIEESYQGQVNSNKESMSIISQDDEMKESIVNNWIARKKMSKLLDLWVKGLDFDWNKLYGEVKPQRVRLPNYPFAKERYWFDKVDLVSVPTKDLNLSVLHPLVHSNTSNFNQQSYSSTFSGEEFFLKDHEVHGQKVLPGVAYLEMARAAIAFASSPQMEANILELRNVIWLRPIVVAEQKQVSIALFADDVVAPAVVQSAHNNQQIEFDIYSEDTDLEGVTSDVIHCQGQAVYLPKSAPAKLDIAQLLSEMQQGQLYSSNIYTTLATMGLNYGPAHQGLVSIALGEKQLLAQLSLPKVLAANQTGSRRNEYLLHPSLMDSALQASIGLIEDLTRPSVPFALERLRIFSACSKEMFAWVRYSQGSHSENKVTKLDIDLCDQEGNICVQMQGFSSRILDTDIGSIRHKTIVNHSAEDSQFLADKTPFDDAFYQKVIESILENEISVDEAVELG
ncbi:MAG: SDR family NAD(P)-dependent oxidoreductase [Pseudomonadota bacterium]